MLTRPKLFFLYLLIPLLLLGGFNYWNSVRATKSAVSTELQRDLAGFNVAVANAVQDQENSAMSLALSPQVQDFGTSAGMLEGTEPEPPVSKTAAQESPAGEVPDALKTALDGFLRSHPYFKNLTVFDSRKRPRLSAQADTSSTHLPFTVVQTKDFSSPLPTPDERVWQYQRSELLTGPVASDAAGPKVVESIPLTTKSGRVSSVLVAQIDMEKVFREMATVLQPMSSSDNNPKAMIMVLDASGKIIYHSNRVFDQQLVRNVMPELTSVAEEMQAGKSGVREFWVPSGRRYVSAFSPLPQLGISLAFARDLTDQFLAAHLRGIAGLVVAVFLALIAGLLLERRFQRRSRGIAQVTEGLSAIAKGELDHRIELMSTDDARGIADNINVVTERLRAQLAREAESRQLESFVKLSAMLTHDLKNAIETLSLIVGNMERHFDNEQFRTDAMKALTGATDKLKGLVARLSKPITTLSGEHKKPVPTDLVPILKRVVALTVEPVREKHTIEINLPPNLMALVDAERIEKVIDNLVINAIEAMSEKRGTLTIAAEAPDMSRVAFSVTDTGAGMSKYFMDNRLFHPFATTKRRGVGLGLYTCREVVQANGGSIEVQSVEGVGTTFRVVLPSPQTTSAIH
jgi:signal transduction histidine kinase